MLVMRKVKPAYTRVSYLMERHIESRGRDGSHEGVSVPEHGVGATVLVLILEEQLDECLLCMQAVLTLIPDETDVCIFHNVIGHFQSAIGG